MAEIDTDGDGFISHEEFTNFARANRGLVRDVAKIFCFLSPCYHVMSTSKREKKNVWRLVHNLKN